MKRFACLLGCAALLWFAGAARAQGTLSQDLGSNWDLRIGFFVSTSDAASDAEGDVWFTAGAERPFYYQDRYSVTLSFDYYGSGGIYTVPICANIRGVTDRLRYGAGLGAGLGHGVNGWAIGLAYNVLLGINLTEGPNPLMFDVRYLGQANDASLNGWAFTLGKTF